MTSWKIKVNGWTSRTNADATFLPSIATTSINDANVVASLFGASGIQYDAMVLNLKIMRWTADCRLSYSKEKSFKVAGNIEEGAILFQLNYWMSGVRQCIKLMYGSCSISSTCWQHHQIKLFANGQTAYCLGVISFFILNCYTCLNGSACNNMFGTMLPILEDYLPLDGALQVYLQQMIIYLWSLHFRLTFIIFLPFLKLKKK